jgi:hypothetical protein
MDPEQFEADRKARKEAKRERKREKKEKKEKKRAKEGKDGEDRESRRRRKEEKKKRRRDSSSSSDDSEGGRHKKKSKNDTGMANMINMSMPAGTMVGGKPMAKQINLKDLASIDAMRAMGQLGQKKMRKMDSLNPQNDPNFPDSFANRRARELYVGGLITGQANRANIKDFFKELLEKLPDFKSKYAGHPQYAGAVKEITISDGSFAFVEFWTEELAASVIEFDGVVFQGRSLKIGRPAKFIPSGPLAGPMDVQPLRDEGLIPSERSQHANMPGYGGKNTPLTRSLQENERQQSREFGDESGSGSNRRRPQGRTPKLQGQALLEKKARELYVGNLTATLCNDQALRDLFTPACEMLPEFNAAAGPAVLSVDVRGGGTFAFVEFQNEALATNALNIFDKMEVGGRQINVGRPSGYVVDPAGNNAPQVRAHACNGHHHIHTPQRNAEL